jgi:sialic acid synthase SpsE
MVKAVREAEASLGTGRKRRVAAEEELHTLARRRIFAVVDIPKGATVTRDMLGILRGTDGLEPKYVERVLGHAARRDIKAHTALTWDDV